MEELRRKAYRRKLFNEQAEKLISRAPALKDEVAWRVDHLNAKWELVEQIMAPIDRPVSSQQADISAGNGLLPLQKLYVFRLIIWFIYVHVIDLFQ